MSEKELTEHLQKALNLYRSDTSALKQECEREIRELNEAHQRFVVQAEKKFQAMELEKNRYEEAARAINLSFNNAKNKIVEQGKQIQNLWDEKNALQQDKQQLNKAYNEGRRKIEELERESQRLREMVKTLEQAAYEERKASEKRTSEYEEGQPILDAFNRWAANPAPVTLPSAFHYVEGEFMIRSKNNYISSSSSISKWIVNTKGGKTYLLPNPLSFNLLTNISELYNMDMSRLQTSNNRIKIIKPCELLDEGYINYPGELIIL